MAAPSSPTKQRRIIACALLVLLLVISGWAPYGKSAAQSIAGETQAPLAFSSGGTINFQGQLTDLAGALLNGGYNIRFAIYDAPSAGNKKWPAGAYEEHTAVPVTGGLFSVQLGSISTAIDASVFNGGGDRYLQVWVCTTAGAGCATYDDMGRLPVSSAAYAQTLALPAALESNSPSALLSVTNSGSSGMLGVNSASSGSYYGVGGQSFSANGYGLYGYASSASGVTSGVFGQTDSGSGHGVYGYAAATTGLTYGVRGVTASSQGSGVSGSANAASGTTYGVSGQSASTAGRGVFGNAYASSGTTYGVYGQSASTSGYGVLGYATSPSGITFGIYGRTDSTDGRGVVGLAAATSGSTRGVIGTANSPDGTGVLGLALASSGLTNGVRGESGSTAGRGVYGVVTAGSGDNDGVFGEAASTSGRGVRGLATASSGATTGVMGTATSTAGRGVLGMASAGTGATSGVHGESWSTAGRGVYGIASATSGSTYGVQGETASPTGRGVYGLAGATTGANFGVYGRSDSANGYGVYGVATASGSGPTYGVYGMSYTSGGYGGKFDGYGADVVHVENLGTGRGIRVDTAGDTAIWAVTSSGLAGVDGRSALSTGRGVYGWATSTTGVNYGVYGRTASSSGYAGYFIGAVHVAGTLSKSAGAFKIDHPLDPESKYLSHSFVESPDMKNLYDGVVILDDSGDATVTLPDWFEALNGGAEHRSDFRYQLTPIGAAMPDLHIAQEIQGNAFKIAGGKPGMKISWQVTGIRHDPYAEQNRIAVETDKPAGEKGTYLYPQGYGRPEQQGLDYERPETLPASRGN